MSETDAVGARDIAPGATSDPFRSDVGRILPWLVGFGAAAVRVGAGLARAEPLDLTLMFLSLVLAVCVVGLVRAPCTPRS